MTEQGNGPESSRLLDTSAVLSADRNHKEDNGKIMIEMTNSGDAISVGKTAAISIEIESAAHPTALDQVPAQDAACKKDPPSFNHDSVDGIWEDLDSQAFPDNCFTRTVEKIQRRVHTFFHNKKLPIYRMIKCVIFIGYITFFISAVVHKFGDEGSLTLVAITIVGLLIILKTVISKRTKCLSLRKYVKLWSVSRKVKTVAFVLKWLLRIGTVMAILLFLIINVWKENPENLRSMLGILGFIAFLFCFSKNPAKVNWHTVFWAIVQQILLGMLILRASWGLVLFEWVGNRVKTFLDFGLAGAKFVFGDVNYKLHKVAVITVSIMVYFNAIIACLFHLGVIQAVINSFGRFLGSCLSTGPIESFAASANVFISLTEMPLLLRPYLSLLTRSELHTVMTCGFASLSGAVLGTYVQFGIPANHLLTASVMSAPAALAVSKLMYPETKRSKFLQMDYKEINAMKHRNIWEAAAMGAANAGGIALATLTNQIAFVSLLAFMNSVLQWMGDRVGVNDVTFKWVCSYAFYPLVYAMGTTSTDCRPVASLLGIKLFGTPIMAYTELASLRNNRLELEHYTQEHINGSWWWDGQDVHLHLTNVTLTGGVISERSEVIALYMLCGISTITSIGICLGVLLYLAEDRKADITGMVVNALVAGNFASFLTAAIAGLLFNGKPLPT